MRSHAMCSAMLVCCTKIVLDKPGALAGTAAKGRIRGGTALRKKKEQHVGEHNTHGVGKSSLLAARLAFPPLVVVLPPPGALLLGVIKAVVIACIFDTSINHTVSV